MNFNINNISPVYFRPPRELVLKTEENFRLFWVRSRAHKYWNILRNRWKIYINLLKNISICDYVVFGKKRNWFILNKNIKSVIIIEKKN